MSRKYLIWKAVVLSLLHLTMASLSQQSSFSFPKEPPLPSIPRASVYGGSDAGRSTNSQTDAIIPAVEEVAMSGKLANVEAQRIMSVLQEVQRKVQQIGLLPDVIDKRVSSVFGGETFNLIKVWIEWNFIFQEHRQLEQKYKTLSDTKNHTEKGLVGHELAVRPFL